MVCLVGKADTNTMVWLGGKEDKNGLASRKSKQNGLAKRKSN